MISMDFTYKHGLYFILFVSLVLYTKDLLNSPGSLLYFKEMLTNFVMGTNSSFLNATFSKVNKK